MKKIVLTIAVAVASFATNAALYNWETSLGDGYDGMTWYVVNGTGVNTLVNLLAVDGDTTGFSDALASYGANVQTGTFEDGWGGWQDGLVTDAASSAFLVVIDSLAEGSTFYYSAELPTADYQYSLPSSSPGSLVFDTVSSGTIASVPEPTSGLMLILGVAGLALRRKQK